MTYEETIQWMFNQLPMYQTQGASAYKKDLTNTLLLAEYLGHPEGKIKAVHIAGTNGKGSVSNMLASVLQTAGYNVGLYTSPHLKDFRERIKINGQDISKDFIMQFMQQHKPFFEANSLSFFEMTVGLAFEYFKAENVDVAIIETGLGGRLDSTNIITPLLSVITNIGMDHTQFLGNTLQAIAGEKAGIIKPGVSVVVGEYLPETKAVFETKAEQCNAQLYFAQDAVVQKYESDLKGLYQHQNIKTVVQSVGLLRGHFNISEEHLTEGLLNVAKNTGFMGRWQQINCNPTAIADTAHNSHGLKLVMQQVKEQHFETLRIVFGVVNDKDLSDILPLLPQNAIYYFCKPSVPRGLDAGILAEEAKKYKLFGKIFTLVNDAYSAAIQDSSENDFIYIGGSTFVVAEIL
ncbi:bifunctional folylpolyglutamate synthase/dihydrofolate synthase [Flavobacterium sp. Sd200]|uniref:bifunctional folylpolyglutamate synthase/dihydrofolate synthase n=1 Tax=Flavobacterium sp. Sd200 TaxID=2692211 RepID=UPI00137006EE|nr:folylpolyglutamate synthase/dihydrofolate synthase family protein [Flavobacterium sp. Sd200]MXN90976.1 bifunctional folylpolyglutamate synthase/dihydrofolate synthase [Flavobacterium sp. Sd200]